MANWFVPFRQLQRREALVGQRVNERTNQSRPHSLTCANLTYVNIQFTQPTSTSHLLNLASCFVSLPLSVSLFFWLPQDLSHVSASSALDLFLFLWLSCDGDPMCFVFARNSQDNFFKCIYIYIYIYMQGTLRLVPRLLVSQYLVQFGSVHVSGAKHFVFFLIISFQMARSREMFSEFIIGDHSGHGIRFIGHRWLLRFAVFSIRWPAKLPRKVCWFFGQFGSFLPRLIGEVFGPEGSWLSAASCV